MSNHPKFLQHLRDSESTRWLVAQYLSSRGNTVSIPPMREAPTAKEWEEYADNGDLEISHRIEVKRLSVDFTNASDWPFGQDFIVCAKHAFDRAKPKPLAFFVVSKSGTHAAIVRSATASKWNVAQRTDRRYKDVSQQFLFAPLDCVEWVEL